MTCKIAHISDLHIRSLSRHAECAEVINAFAEQCKSNEIDHIFIGGDLFHTKTSGMSPECVEFMCWMFNRLADVAEVHVTLGNHDGNLVNFSRQDAISPIIDAIKNPRVHLYKKSGCYEFSPGYVWCVFSLFDVEGWKSVNPIPGKVNIACYHGPIRGAATESNWTIEDGVTLELFNGYDFAMLGDIHRFQFLGFRDVEIEIDESELSNYPGAEIIEG